MVGDPATERGADGGRRDDGHAVKRKGGSSLGRRESIDQDGLLNGSEATAADALQNSEKDEPSKAGSEPTQ